MQGQDPRGARLSVRARTRGLSAADVDRALSEERSLLIAWLNRGTLQLVRSEDYAWLHAVTTPPLLNESVRRLGVEGISAEVGERAMVTIERALADEGPLTRAELRAVLEEDGLPTAGQAFSHLCFRAGVLGILVRGPMIGKQHAYVLARDWLGDLKPVDRDAALAELARRYLVGHAPAGDRDLARWAGLPLRDARAGLAAIAAEVEEREDGLLQLSGRSRGARSPRRACSAPSTPSSSAGPPARKSPARTPSWSPPTASSGPSRWSTGSAVATWRLAKGKVAIEPLGRISKKDRAALDADAADVERFMQSRRPDSAPRSHTYRAESRTVCAPMEGDADDQLAMLCRASMEASSCRGPTSELPISGRDASRRRLRQWTCSASRDRSVEFALGLSRRP